MAEIRIRHYVVKAGNSAYWQPSKHARKFGWKPVRLGKHGPHAWKEAEAINTRWDAFRKSQGEEILGPRPGTLEAVFTDYQKTNAWREKAASTRDEWAYAWGHIKPIFGDQVVADIRAIPDCDDFYAGLREGFSHHKAHRIFKILRALLNVAIAAKLITTNPTMIVKNSIPQGRSQTWQPHEVEALIGKAAEMNLHGLSVLLRIAYDTQFSPVDIRTATLAQLIRDPAGSYFEGARGKTGKRTFGTISADTLAAIDGYLDGAPFTPLPSQPFLRARNGVSYNRQNLSTDFRKVKAALFPGDKRQILDFRRTGTVEAAVGGATPSELSAKSSNTIGTSARLHETYNPTQLATVRAADERRRQGREKLANK